MNHFPSAARRTHSMRPSGDVLDHAPRVWFAYSMKTVLMLTLALSAMLLSGMQAAPEEETGKPFQLTTLTGDTYKNCRILKVTPETMTVMHDAGVSKISFENLSDEWRTKFRYDPAKAEEFARAEEQRAKEAAEKREVAMKKQQLREEEKMDILVARERQRLAAEKAAAELGPPLAPAPLPGDATPQLGTGASQPVEEIVPSLSPITQVYTPGAGTYRQYGRDRYGYLYSGFYGYGYPYVPIYGGGSGYCPPHHHHHHHSGSSYVQPIIRGSFSVGGNTVIRVNR
jgi:hypothetical protein